jgi:hypothetical protein
MFGALYGAEERLRREIGDGGERREEKREHDRREDEPRRVVDTDRLERELADPAPEEDVLDDRQARY